MVRDATKALLAVALGLNACRSGSRSERWGTGDDLEALRALGYVDVAVDVPAGSPIGVLQHDASLAAPGLVYFTSVGSCSSHLIAADGSTLKTWQHTPCRRWGNTVLLPSGEVLVVHSDPPDPPTPQGTWEARALLKLGNDGSLIWRKQLPVHHDVEATPSGNIATLTYRHRLIPEIDKKITVRDHFITLLTANGDVVDESSVTDLLLASPDVFEIRKVRPQQKDWMLEIDLIHSNSVEWMRHPHLIERHPIYSEDNLLLCLRHQDAIVIIDWPQRKVIWSWGPGELSGPHDASVLPTGNILVFDNGLKGRRSRVVEIDPIMRKIVWQYHTEPRESFFSRTRGSAQRLPNGNTLITNSNSGLIFEVTPEGRTVWSFRNTDVDDEGKPLVVVRARKFSTGSTQPSLPTEPID